MLSDLSTRFEHDERWEIFYERTDRLRLELGYSTPVEVAVSWIDGVGVRLVANQHLGFSSTSDLTQVESAIRAARQATRLGMSTKIEFPGPAHYPPVENFDSQVASMSVEEANNWITEGIQRAALTRVRNLLVTVDRDVMTRQIVNHQGLDIEDRLTTLRIEMSGSISEGFDLLRESELSCRCDIDLEALTERFLNRYERCQMSRCTERLKNKLPAVFSESSMLSLLQVLEGSLVDIVNLPDNPLLEELRKVQLTRADVTLIDQGTTNWLPGSAPFDDEGVPKQELKIMEQGWLKTSIFDLQTACLKGEKPTGHAFRRFDSMPVVRFNHPYLLPGRNSATQMESDLNEGLIIDQLRNVQRGSKALCDFTAEVGIGFYVQNGHENGLVENLRISGNFFHLLGPHLVAISDKVRRHRRGSTPAVMVKEIDIHNLP